MRETRPMSHATPSVPVAPHRAAFIPRWIVTVAGAEALGFAIAAGIALSAVANGIEGFAALAIAVGGGVIEGTLLGAGQWRAMGRRRPRAVA